MGKKKILIFGSTGSVGRNVLELVKAKKAFFEVIGLCSNCNAGLLAEQIRDFRPKFACLNDLNAAQKLKKQIKNKCKLLEGQKGLEEFARLNADISVMAISKIDCLKPLLINIPHVRRIALANKEAVVAAGKFIFRKAKKYKTEIIPVDSEINALFQLLNLNGLQNKDIEKAYLTASGGALLNYDKKALKKVTPKQVLNHPTWDMGKRITVDSATLVNKAFEVIEIHEFFGIDYKKIDILLHRQSLMHAMLKLKDQTYFSCVYPPDMKNPIAFSLFYPQRIKLPSGSTGAGNFNFSCEPIPYQKFPLLKIILKAAWRKDNSLVILNAADEIVVDYFLNAKIKFSCIEKTIKKIFKIYPSSPLKTIKDVYYWNNWAKTKTKDILEKNRLN